MEFVDIASCAHSGASIAEEAIPMDCDRRWGCRRVKLELAAGAMKLQIASGLHHEYDTGNASFGKRLPLAHRAEALVLAGDIHSGTKAIDLYWDYPVPVVYVHGESELVDISHAKFVAEVREKARGTSVHLLQNDERVIDHVRFLGAYMRSPQLFPFDEHDRTRSTRNCPPHDSPSHRAHRDMGEGADEWSARQKTLRWLSRRLHRSFAGQTVVVTYHPPSKLHIPGESRQRPRGGVPFNGLGALAAKADYWIHGHTHQSTDYNIGTCRVVCNPRGLPVRRAASSTVQYENHHFRIGLILDTDRD